MTNKITKREVFNAVIAMAKGDAFTVDAADIIAAMEHELELLNKKSTKAAGPNPEFAEIETKIMDFLAGKGATSTSDVAKALGISTQKAAPRLKALEAAGSVVTSTVKGKTLYAAA